MSEIQLPPLIAIVGPTGVGKTTISISLAARLNAEIVSADSRQVYRKMPIGTARPTDHELATIPHHLVAYLDPDDELTLATYQASAYEKINDIHSRGKLPMLVGGTGQYARSVLEGWGVPEVPPDPVIRSELEAFADEHGPELLHTRLASVDPVAATAIDYRNIRRVVRALEVHAVTGKPISTLQKLSPPPYRILWIGLTLPRPLLYDRVDRRIDAMLEEGLVDEVKRLITDGYAWNLPSMTSLGYGQISSYLRGESTLPEAVALIRKATRRFIRSQYNWFRLRDPRITWFDLSESDVETIYQAIFEWLMDDSSQ